MFNHDVVAALLSLGLTRTSEGYLNRQEVLAQDLPCEYEELVDVAYDHETVVARIEALELIAVMARPGFQIVLSDSAKADPDEKVREHAEGLLFRAIVAEQMRKAVTNVSH